MEIYKAIQAWSKLLGNSQVLDNEAAQLKYGSCTTGIHRNLLGAVQPLNRLFIPKIINIARQFKTPLYPISTGHNWGYGTALPVSDDCVILDLSRLNKIIDFDTETGVLTIEPGVTQEQLATFLEQNSHPYMVPVTGAGPTCSLLGNALERGYGITPYSDHFGAVMAIESVLPDGRIYRSALSESGGDQLDRLFKWGIGPYLDGLFSQSAFGVVTQMTVALARRPESTKSFIFGIRNKESLGNLVACVREIITRYPGVVGGINLMNAHRVLAMTTSYPTDQLEQDGTIPPRLLLDLCKENRVMPWTGFGTLYASNGVIKAVQKEIKAILRPHVSQLIFVNAQKIGLLSSLSKLLPDRFRHKIKQKLVMLERSQRLVEGFPNETALQLCYWRKNKQLQMKNPHSVLDPARDKCGLIWYAPLVPMKSTDVINYVQMVLDITKIYKIEPLITLTSLSNRCFDSTVPILFDLESAEKIDDANNCYWSLLNEGCKHGYLPYRVGIQAMSWLSKDQTTYWELVRELKKTIDPDSIVSPGRYV